MGNIAITNYFEVCRTGKLSQYYTLYVERLVSGDNFSTSSYYFMQNLSKEEGKAVAKADSIMNKLRRSGVKCYMDVVESPKREYCDLKAFDLPWKKTRKGFTTHPTKLVWEMWRQHKSDLKDAGFSIFKGDLGWIFFFKNTTDEKMAEAFDILQDKFSSKVVTGEYYGEKGERITVMTNIKSIRKFDGYYGPVQAILFETAEGTFFTNYSGQVEFEVGMNLTLTGTIKDHKEYDGVKRTILNRIRADIKETSDEVSIDMKF